MAIKVIREDKQMFKEIKAGSFVKPVGSDSVVYMIVEDIENGNYKVLNIENGHIFGTKHSIKSLVDLLSLELITNNADIILKDM